MPGRDCISQYCSTTWSEADAVALSANVGDCASQAVWECYMLLLAVTTWQQTLIDVSGSMQVIGDAEGVLKAVLARRAKAPTINKLVMEIQLVLGPSMQDIYATHIWSEDNEIADMLSRRSEGAELPSSCSTASEAAVVRPRLRFLKQRNGR